MMFTISPTVRDWRAATDNRRAFWYTATTTVDRRFIPTRNTRKKYCAAHTS